MRKIKKKYILILPILMLMILIPYTFSKYKQQINKQITINARQPIYTIVFNKNGGTGSMQSQTFNYGTAQTLSKNTFIKENYIFNGWNTEPDGTGTSYTDEQEINNLSSVDGTTIDLYAMWEEGQKVTVTFNASEGTTPSFQTKEVYINDVYGQLPTTSKTGYTFLGWTQIPNEYQEIDYIESTGTQYINTGYYATANTRIELEAMVTDNSNANSWTQITGTKRYYHDSNSFQIAYNTNTEYLAIDYGTNGTTFENNANFISKNTKFKVIIENNNHKINNNTGTNNGEFSGTVNYPIWIFSTNNYGNPENPFKGRIYSYKIYENNTLMKNFIPCYKRATNEVGLYDTISNTFYSNQGTDSFRKGNLPDKYISETTTVTTHSNHTLYAIWGKNVNITFEPNGGSVSEQNKNVIYNTKYGSLPTPERAGYTFLGWNTSNKFLPDEYQNVEFIQSTGSQTINTGYYATVNTKIELQAMITETNRLSEWTQITGARNSYRHSSALQVGYYLVNDYLHIDYGTNGTTFGNNANIIYRNQIFYVKVENNNHIINDTTGTNLGTFSGTSSYPLWIFDENNAGSMERRFVGRIYYYKIYENNNLERDYVPCYRKSDNKVGLYDLINGTFNTDIYNNNFIKGSDTDFYITENSIVKEEENHTLYAIWKEN